MSSHETNSGKTLLHGSEAGEITPAMIEHRAREIALIEGRELPAGAHRRVARQELQGLTLPDTTSDDSAVIANSFNRDLSDPVSVPGHQTPVHNNDGDDPDMIERLAIEGVEEAQHEQMLASRRQKTP